MHKINQNKGFTLIEIMVVMTIIAVLFAVLVNAIKIAQHMATETTNRSNVKKMETCLEAYLARNKVYCGQTQNTLCYPANPGTGHYGTNGVVINDVAQELASDGISCGLSKTPTVSSDCSDPNNGCSGRLMYLEESRYQICTHDYTGSSCIETVSAP